MLKDSSLLIDWDNIDPRRYSMKAYNRGEEKMEYMSKGVLAKRLLNQIGITKPTGTGRKEFIENLAGNYLVIDNINNVARGSDYNYFGYMGDSLIDTHPVELVEPTDNGKTFKNETWFSFSKVTMFAVLSSYTEFYRLLIKAGLVDTRYYKFTFISDGDYITVMAPTNEAIIKAGLDTLNKKDLENVLRYHFIRDELIFTDGHKPPGLYETLRIDESSNEFSVVYSTMNINPGVDYIDILDAKGNLYYKVVEKEGKTNVMTVTGTGNKNDKSFWNFITTGVVHKIDTVIIM
jgi:uncharacterized surface protein with fasciclin (FAS1) repeats